MTDAKRLLSEATPLPWQVIPESEYRTGRGVRTVQTGIEATDPLVGILFRAYSNASPADAALIVYAVNHLPDYEAAVEAFASLFDMIDNKPESFATAEYRGRWAACRFVLARLREGEAAHVR